MSLHKQINIHGEVSIDTEHIQYIKRCKPYGNEDLSKSQLMIKLYDGDKIYINLTAELAKEYYNKINHILTRVKLEDNDDYKTEQAMLGIPNWQKAEQDFEDSLLHDQDEREQS